MKLSRSQIALLAAIVVAFIGGLMALGAKYGLTAALATYVLFDGGARCLMLSDKLGAIASISNLWNPPIWIGGLAERVTTRPSLINSGILITSPEVKAGAEGEGKEVVIPFLKEVHADDDIQVEDNSITLNGIASGTQKAPILNRRVGFAATALARASVNKKQDPLMAILDFIADNRLRNRQKTLLASLRGVFGFAAAPNAGSAAFKSLRRDIFIEAGASATAANLFSSDEFIKTVGLWGETKDQLDDCVICCHSVIEQAMLLADDITTIRDSEGKKRIRTYKDAPVFVTDGLYRAGGTNGSVYDTYIFRRGSVAGGEKDQVSEVGNVAAFLKLEDAFKNNVGYADYTRFILHPQGALWGGTPAGQSATNAELATEANWTLGLADIKNAGVACLRTNG